MICPTCDGNLSVNSIEGIELDVCKEGCGGIWFDRFELQKMDEPHEFTDENLIELLSANSKIDRDQSKRHICPKCSDITMMRNFYSVKKEVEIDHCPKCAGYWLDEGELFQIRKEHNTDDDRTQAAIKYFSGIFDGELSVMKKESKEKAQQAQQAQKIANMFRLITPSYYYK